MSTPADVPPVSPSAPLVTPNPGQAAQIVLAVLASAAALTYLGPVLQPFLVAVFLFYAMRFGVKTLARLGMRPWSAYAALIGLILIASILLAQFVLRESSVFLKTWPRYEDRIAAFLAAWSPARTIATRAAPLVVDSSPAGGEWSPVGGPQPIEPSGEDVADRRVAANAGLPGQPAELPEETADFPLSRKPVGEVAGKDDFPPGSGEVVPARPAGRSVERSEPGPRSSLTELFRISSQDVLNYVFSHSLDVAELFTLVFFYLIFLVLGSRKLEARVLRAFPGERGERVLAIGQGISESMERFMIVKTVVGVGMGVSAAVVMYLFGLDHWLLWAFVFFASNYITYIGSMAACIPPVVLAFLDLDSPVAATILGVLIVLNRLFWIDLVELRMSGRQLNLDPTLLFLWLSYWGWSWGVLGLILAYPMMAAVKISLWHLGGARGWAMLLSDE